MKNAKKSSWKKLLAGFAVGGVLLSGLAVVGNGASGSLITDASAGVAGGGGGGGGGGAGGTAYATWQQLSRTKVMNGTISNLPPELSDPICQDAEAYFALVPNSVGANAQRDSWTFALYGVRGLQGADFAGGADLATRIANNVGWSYQQGRDYLYQKNFICLDNPNVLDERQWRYEVRSTSSKDSLNETQPYSYTTQIAPQAIEGTLDPIGAKNLETQTATAQKTNYGKVWDAFKTARTASGANTKDLVSQFKDRFAQAKAADKSFARADTALSENNKAGMGEGGILNITEFTRTATATASTTSNKYQVWRCGWEHYSKSGWQPSSSNNCQTVGGSTLNPNALPTSGWNSAVWKNSTERNEYNPVKSGQTSWTRYSTSATSPTPTQKTTGFWQILAVHCNPQQFSALVSALGSNGTALSSGDSSNTISGFARTKFYSSKPSVLPFGDPNNTNAALKASSKLGFYDKECPFDCTPNKATSAGASAANGATSNVGTAGFTTVAKGKYGSKSSDNINSSYSEMFRDNTDRTVRPDVWYPAADTARGVSYDGSAPKTTLVTRWAGGTPTLGSEFNAYYTGADNKKTKLFGTGTTQLNQKNFDAAKGFSTSTAAQVPGRLDKITVQSTWASDNGKPQAMQIAWEYSPTVTSKVPSTVSFANGGGNLKIGAMTNRNTKVDGRCWGTFGTTALQRATADLNANTGSGATTNFSVPNGNVDTARNLVLNFVRGTSE